MTISRQLPKVGWVKVNVDGMVEARAILEGLKLVWDRGFRQVELECDNAMLIEFIRNGWASKVKSRHIQRDANKVVDCIAKANGGMMDQLIIFEDSSRYVQNLLEEDIRQSLLITDRLH
ncbi:hypothetical protein Goshw_024642 [Gossypium schwendimanii]|uniref:RNase H type-1 domain-containing protein n=1 Tax=Gossypium schwendimanii TaxID=34291 RepID=A0A7J9KV51_GOSSC|nr:hypothetical protein [Gossypium schwendimanii]